RGRNKGEDADNASTGTSKTNAKSTSSAATKTTDDGNDSAAANATSSSATPATSAAKAGNVPKGFGRLVVEPAGKAAPANALIYIGEKSYGPLGQPIVVPCGYRWILAGVPNAKGRLTT